ncbi:hypothetical protein WR25_10961 [Diploscapter pachys]|uniref:NOG C-terminal domain-containing protein n=1 Tax=Diploscapter pachys TaxID=2018661 RepID=A0A2A2LY27_9BILA|nr:hypothetical protein WR25_10961 [Diploscapter pachys]
MEMSTINGNGVMEIKDKACDELLAQRVEAKLQSKKASTTDDSILNRLFVAFPTPRDDKVRAPHVPQVVLEKRMKASRGQGDATKVGTNKIMRDEATRKLERELELELEDEYILDLKKNYMLKNEDEKYDVVPEIWEGHNLADFVDPEIEQKMAALLEEEELREKAGEYDSDLDSDDEETKERLKLAQQIREKEKLLTLESQENKKTAGRSGSRTNVRKRERSVSRLTDDLEDLGVEVDPKRMKNLQGQMAKAPLGKKVKVGRSRSLSANRPAPRDEIGIPDKKTRDKASKLRLKVLQGFKRDARKGEADRHIYDLKPKHLFSGKRKMGKTDRR